MCRNVSEIERQQLISRGTRVIDVCVTKGGEAYTCLKKIINFTGQKF